MNQNYYGVQLINDLHNYFPEILYSNRFQNDPLVQYIRQQVSNRFNLFTNAQNQHLNNLQNQNLNRVATIENNDPLALNILFTNNNQNSLGSSIANLFQTILQGTDDLESVIIRPTNQQIEATSSIVEIMNSQESCAICQEHMNPNDRIRRLNQCRHMFHNQCILTAFQTSVRCPVCRHDIRS